MSTRPGAIAGDEQLWLDRMVSDLLADEPVKSRRTQTENPPERAPVGVTPTAKETK